MRLFRTILLFLLAALAVTMAVFMAIDGNLARITGWYRYEVGMPLFSRENAARLGEVSWMRLSDLHDTIECSRDEQGAWWITTPFHDRLNPEVVAGILNFTARAKLVETLPNTRGIRRNMREYGVESNPIRITLKVANHDGDYSTVARYTLGNPSPWLEDAGNGIDVIPTTYLRTDFYGRDKRIHVVSGNISHYFKNGLEALRDPRPLKLEPEALQEISITGSGEHSAPLRLHRLSSESPWTIIEPIPTAADDDAVRRLTTRLCRLSALRVSEPVDVELPETPEWRIRLQSNDGTPPIELCLYPPFRDAESGSDHCYATVSDRPVVFTLPAERPIGRQGSYANLINAVCELPVLPSKAMAQIRAGHSTTYTRELQLSLPELRSLQLLDIDPKDIARFSLIDPQQHHSLLFRLIPGNTDNQVEDVWVCSESPGRRRPYTAESPLVQRFLRSLGDIPAEAVVADARPGEDMTPLLSPFGLDHPRYILMLQPNPCAVRAKIFGQDLPLVKDRQPRTVLIARATAPGNSRAAWYAHELNTGSIKQLKPLFTRQLSLRVAKWKQRSLTDFPISAVRRLTLGYAQAPLIIDYDYIGESWSGTLDGQDITPRINPHRAEYYIRRLQKLKVSQWLEADDPEALAILAKPVFRVQLDLEIVDYSDAEAAIIRSKETASADSDDTEALLQGGDAATAEQLRDIALAERPTRRETRTIEIAPAVYDSDKPHFYGRLVETGELFLLTFDDAQGLAGDILDM
ncbi:MAG: DUF4340 domain-containing protein [Akkermansia sp.]